MSRNVETANGLSVELIDDEPVFEIFVLGTRASGKSVLMSSLYRHLSAQDGVRNFFARSAGPEQHASLWSAYQELLDVDRPWPSGTFEIEHYEFVCSHHLSTRSVPLFRLRYHDYPGGFIGDPKMAGSNFIEERAKVAHTVLVLIDGMKLIRTMHAIHRSPHESIFFDLDKIVPVLQLCVGKPIHFVVTKADVIDFHTHSLKKISDFLHGHKGFSDIVRQQVQELPCYLIPVSAVGMRFAKPNLQTGQMTKRSDGIIEPIYIDVSISLTIFDIVRRASRRGEAPDPELLKRLGRRRAGTTFLQVGRPGALPLMGHILNPFIGSFLYALSMLLQTGLSASANEIQSIANTLSRNESNRNLILAKVLEIQYLVAHKFLKDNPSSYLLPPGKSLEILPTQKLSDLYAAYRIHDSSAELEGKDLTVLIFEYILGLLGKGVLLVVSAIAFVIIFFVIGLIFGVLQSLTN